MNARNCSSCGAPLGDNDQFCGSCGAPSAPPATAPAEPPTAPVAPATAPAGPPTAPVAPADAGRGRALRTGLLVVLGAAVPILIGLAVYVLIAGGGDETATTSDASTPPAADGTTAPSDASTPAATAPPATAPPVTAPPATDEPPATAPSGTDAPPATAPATTQPPAPTRNPVSVWPGRRDECEWSVGTGGPLVTFDQKFSGFDIAIARELIDRVWDTRKVCYVELTAAERLTALEQRRVQLLVRSFVATTSRDERADFTQPYLINDLAVAAPSSAGLTPDLAGLTVGVASGGTDAGLLLDNTDLRRLREFTDFTATSEAFESGDVDAMAGSWTVLHQQFGDDPDIEIVVLGLRPEPFVVAVREGADSRRELLDEALAEMIADGTWAAIFAAEFGTEPFFDPATLVTYEPIDR